MGAVVSTSSWNFPPDPCLASAHRLGGHGKISRSWTCRRRSLAQRTRRIDSGLVRCRISIKLSTASHLSESEAYPLPGLKELTDYSLPLSVRGSSRGKYAGLRANDVYLGSTQCPVTRLAPYMDTTGIRLDLRASCECAQHSRHPESASLLTPHGVLLNHVHLNVFKGAGLSTTWKCAREGRSRG